MLVIILGRKKKLAFSVFNCIILCILGILFFYGCAASSLLRGLSLSRQERGLLSVARASLTVASLVAGDLCVLASVAAARGLSSPTARAQFPGKSSQTSDGTCVSPLAGGFFPAEPPGKPHPGSFTHVSFWLK